MKLCEDEKRGLLKDIFSFNYGFNHGFPQIEDATLTPTNDILPDSVTKAMARLGEGEGVERSLNVNSGPDDGLNHGFEQTQGISSPLLDGIAQVHISDRRRSRRQLEEVAAESGLNRSCERRRKRRHKLKEKLNWQKLHVLRKSSGLKPSNDKKPKQRHRLKDRLHWQKLHMLLKKSSTKKLNG
jgi:hypothetical protein